MSTPEDVAGEAVVCPSCQKNLQVPPNAPRLPKHLEPSVNGASPQAAAMAAGGSPYARGGAAVAAPPVPGGNPMLATTSAGSGGGFPKVLILVAGVVILLVGAVVVFAITQGNKKTVIKGNKAGPVVRIDDNPPPRHPTSSGDQLEATQLFKEYWENQLAADNSYKDRELTVTGVVQSVSSGSELVVNLRGGGRQELTKRIKCYFDGKYKGELASLKPDKKLQVKGICQGKVEGQVVLKNCQCFDPSR
jgi:hypothetical protein